MMPTADNIPGRIAEAIFPGRRVFRLTIHLEVGTLATVEAEIYCGDELRTVLGVIGEKPAWRFVEDRQPQDGVVRLPPLDPNGAPGWNAAIGAVREALAEAGVDWDTE